MTPTTLVITNDFPPGIGGIEVMVRAVCDVLADVVVLTGHAGQPGTTAADAAAPGPVHRRPGTLLPTAAVAQQAEHLIRTHQITQIVFGAAAPLGLLAGRLRPHVERIVALSHGHECWWAQVPGTRRLLRRIGDDVDVLTTISQHTEAIIAAALSPAARQRLRRLPPPVDARFFAAASRSRTGPTVLAAARLVPQKGLDTLLRAWARTLPSDAQHGSSGQVPRLLIAGDGPQRRRLERRAGAGVEFLGSVSHAQMPQLMAAADVLALPVRTRLGGWYAEGFGLVFAEAQAAGLPVLAGDSGGVADVVDHGHTGYVLDPTDVDLWAHHLHRLMTDSELRDRLGTAGVHRAQAFSHARFADRVRALMVAG